MTMLWITASLAIVLMDLIVNTHSHDQSGHTTICFMRHNCETRVRLKSPCLLVLRGNVLGWPPKVGRRHVARGFVAVKIKVRSHEIISPTMTLQINWHFHDCSKENKRNENENNRIPHNKRLAPWKPSRNMIRALSLSISPLSATRPDRATT